jgi:hypothetical protein
MPDATNTTTDARWIWLTTMPQGPAKTFVALSLLIGTSVVIWVGVLMEKDIKDVWMYPLLGAILGVLGVSHLDFRVKRNTYIPSPPNEPDIEDAKAGVTMNQEEPPDVQRFASPGMKGPLWPHDFETAAKTESRFAHETAPATQPHQAPLRADVPIILAGKPIKDE